MSYATRESRHHGYRRTDQSNHGAPQHQQHQDPRAWTPEKHDPVAAEIRNRIVDRLTIMNSRHALNAWDLRRKTPIGPHGLAFLYADPIPGGEKPRYDVAAGTRLFLDGEDVRDLSELLGSVIRIASGRLERGEDFDPLACMVDRADTMSSEATYVGVGVSTLDTPDMSWAESQVRATGPLGVPGRCYGLLSDGTRLLVDRAAHMVGPARVHSSRHLDVEPGNPTRRWSWLSDQYEDPEGPEHWLAQLHYAVAEGQRRLVAGRPRNRR